MHLKRWTYTVIWWRPENGQARRCRLRKSQRDGFDGYIRDGHDVAQNPTVVERIVGHNNRLTKTIVNKFTTVPNLRTV